MNLKIIILRKMLDLNHILCDYIYIIKFWKMLINICSDRKYIRVPGIRREGWGNWKEREVIKGSSKKF